MTIIDAVKQVLSESDIGMTTIEIYEEILKKNLYHFGAKKPLNVLNVEIRRRCQGIEFPTAYPNKVFICVGTKEGKNLYALPGNKKTQGNISTSSNPTVSEPSLEERLVDSFNKYYVGIKEQILDAIQANDPSFFEHLVVDLLLAMGYGYDHNSGIVTGKSHDGGIDGIIFEDNLGLDKIYIQAKRYASGNTVGSKELQAFIGAMENTQKGVFITTSSYSKEAIAFAERQQQKHLRLIDGDKLSELILKFEIGIKPVKSFSIYTIDSDYYG